MPVQKLSENVNTPQSVKQVTKTFQDMQIQYLVDSPLTNIFTRSCKVTAYLPLFISTYRLLSSTCVEYYYINNNNDIRHQIIT